MPPFERRERGLAAKLLVLALGVRAGLEPPEITIALRRRSIRSLQIPGVRLNPPPQFRMPIQERNNTAIAMPTRWGIAPLRRLNGVHRKLAVINAREIGDALLVDIEQHLRRAWLGGVGEFDHIGDPWMHGCRNPVIGRTDGAAHRIASDA